jgi:phage tail sheath gpL-like
MAVSTAVPASSKAAVLGIKTEYRNLAVGALFGLPQRCGLIGQGATASTFATTKAQVFSANEVGSTYGFGSPLHLAALQLLPVNGDGIGSIPLTVYPLVDDGAATAAAGDITPTPGSIVEASYYVVVNNIRSAAFTVEVGDAVADIVGKMVTAINAESTMPVIAADGTTKLDVTAKWKGPTGNDIYLEVTSTTGGVATGSGVTWAFTQPTGGATNPSVTAALAQVGDVWETMFVNCLDIADTTTLDEYAAFGEGRWGALTHKPCMFFTGNTEATLATAITVSDARGTDRTNGQLVSPGSNDLPFVVAARQAARMLVVANENPPVAYGGQRATGLVPGVDGDQWTYAQRDTAVKSGSSTIKVVDGVVTLEDIVTFYHPTGDPLPAYSYAVDNVKLMNIIFNTDIIFSDPAWKSAPLIPDDQPTTNSAARKPKDAKAAIASLIDSLALAAIISDPETAKGTIVAEINGSNPKRLDVTYTVQLSGNTKIISVDLFFGFYFGTAQAA